MSERSTTKWLMDWVLNPLDDFLYWLVPKWWWPRYRIALCRRFLTEGKTRRLLRKALRQWVKTTIMSESYFRQEELKADLEGKIIVVNISRREDWQK